MAALTAGCLGDDDGLVDLTADADTVDVVDLSEGVSYRAELELVDGQRADATVTHAETETEDLSLFTEDLTEPAENTFEASASGEYSIEVTIEPEGGWVSFTLTEADEE